VREMDVLLRHSFHGGMGVWFIKNRECERSNLKTDLKTGLRLFVTGICGIAIGFLVMETLSLHPVLALPSPVSLGLAFLCLLVAILVEFRF